MKHVLRKGQVAALIVLLFAGGVYAQDKKDETSPPAPVKEEITVTGTRFERPIDLTPQSISVLPSEEIHTRPLGNVQSLLGDVPGVWFSPPGAGDGQVVIRGFSSGASRQVLFIDGDRFRGRVSLEYSFLDPNEIDRLEIIRGPAAALYGADAMNGVGEMKKPPPTEAERREIS